MCVEKVRLGRLLLLLLIGMAGSYVPAAAGEKKSSIEQNDPEFFMSLEDIPLMQGLTELSDRTVSYDKPEGKIVESVASMQGVTRVQVLNYYRAVLPQFGWQLMDEGNMFFRGHEYIEIAFDEEAGQSFVRIMVKPTL